MAQDTRKPGAERQEQRTERTEAPRTEREEAADKVHMAAVELRVKQYMDAVDLTEEQAVQMSRIFMQEERELAPLREECANLQAKMHGRKEGFSKQTNALLTPDQQDKLEKMRQAGAFQENADPCGARSEKKEMSETERKEALQKQKTEAPATPGMDAAPAAPAPKRR